MMNYVTRELKDAYERVEELYNTLQTIKTCYIQEDCYKKIAFEILQCPDLLNFWDLKNSPYFEKRVVLVRTLEKNIPIAENENDVEWLSIFGENIATPTSYGYIIKLNDLGMIKVGKTNNLKTRMKQLSKQYGSISIVHTFGFNNEEDAYIMEIILHKYFKEKYPNNFIPQDRFANATVTTEDIQTLENSAKKIKETNWF